MCLILLTQMYQKTQVPHWLHYWIYFHLCRNHFVSESLLPCLPWYFSLTIGRNIYKITQCCSTETWLLWTGPSHSQLYDWPSSTEAAPRLFCLVQRRTGILQKSQAIMCQASSWSLSDASPSTSSKKRLSIYCLKI